MAISIYVFCRGCQDTSEILIDGDNASICPNCRSVDDFVELPTCETCGVEFDVQDDDEENYPEDCPSCAEKKKVLYVNAYRVTQEYGGPEEGGWWYRHREPLKSVHVLYPEQVNDIKSRLEAEYAHEKRGNSVSDILGGNPDDLDSTEDFEPNDMTGVETGVEVEVVIEHEPAQRTQKPRYE